MNTPIPISFFEKLAGMLPQEGERILLACPPGELAPVAQPCLEAVGESGRCLALVRGEPFLHGLLPRRLDILDQDPGRPEGIQGPFDLVLVFGSHPFLRLSLQEALRPFYDCLRPGGRIGVDIPAFGFDARILAAHPDAGRWVLPSRGDLHGALSGLGFREIEVNPHVELRSYPDLNSLVEDFVQPCPFDYEGDQGQRVLETFRAQLASAFRGSSEPSLGLRRMRAKGRR